MCFKKRIRLCRKGFELVDVQEEMRLENIRKDRKLRAEMLEEQGLKLLPESHGTKIGKNGVWLVLAYSYREYSHTQYKSDNYDPTDEGIELFTQEWTYYAWDKLWKRWMQEGGHRQTTDEASYNILKSA